MLHHTSVIMLEIRCLYVVIKHTLQLLILYDRSLHCELCFAFFFMSAYFQCCEYLFSMLNVVVFTIRYASIVLYFCKFLTVSKLV